MLIPKTRKEIYQAYLSGDTHLELPRPVTRDEIILYNACINGAGTNPSWNDLTDKPFGENDDGTITTIDPKYLPNGGGAGAFVVTFTQTEETTPDGKTIATTDKTYEEVLANVKEGNHVVGKISSSGMDCYLCLGMVMEGTVIEFYMLTSFSGVMCMVAAIYPDGRAVTNGLSLSTAT